MSRASLFPWAAVAVLIAATLSCESPTEPPPDDLIGIGIGIGDGDEGDDDGGSTGDPDSAAPLRCPTTESFTASKTIGVFGGTVSAGGSSITLPLGAVLRPTTITLTVPPSEYMEIDIEANGEEHFAFLTPATITIGYARCTDVGDTPLVAWYWDSLLEILLEPFPSVDDRDARTVTFESGHLSGFVIAN